MSNTALDRDGVKAKFDVWPEQIIDYLALVGDSSDNIPGIDKVGPKTAAKWLGTYQHASTTCIAHAADISGKVGENLRAGLDTLALSRKLATIRTDLELAEDPHGFARQPPDTAKLRELYTQLEFRGLLQGAGWRRWRRRRQPPRAARRPPCRRRRSSTRPWPRRGTPVARCRATTKPSSPKKPCSAGWQLLQSAELTAFDTETTSLDYRVARIVGMSFCVEAGKAAYLPLAHRYAGAPDQLDLERTLALLKPWLEDASRAQGRPSPEVRRACAAQPRHRARRHAARLDAGVLRARTAWPRATTWIRWRSTTSASTPSSTRRWPARARSRSASTRCRWKPRRRMRPKMPT